MFPRRNELNRIQKMKIVKRIYLPMGYSLKVELRYIHHYNQFCAENYNYMHFKEIGKVRSGGRGGAFVLGKLAGNIGELIALQLVLLLKIGMILVFSRK